MPRELHSFELDRELARLVPAFARARRARDASAPHAALPSHDALFDPETIERIASTPSEPLSLPLLRWLYRLERERSEFELAGRVVRAYREERHPIERPLAGQFTLRELLERALLDRARRPELFERLFEHGGGLRDALARRAERRAELTHFGRRSRDELELPSDGLPEVADLLLSNSRDALASLEIETLSDWVEVGLAHGAADGWPRRLDARSLHDLIAEGGLFRSLEPSLGRLPAALAPASFLRGLHALGEGFVRALAPASQPFALAHDPFGLSRHTHGALLTLVPLTAPFLRKTLGLGGERVRRAESALARSWLLHTRTLALRLHLRAPELGSPRAFGEALSEQGARVFGFELDPRASGVFFRPRAEDAQKLAGALLAASLFARLREEHDEDWFRNPRAVEQLREAARVVPRVTCSRAELEAGARELARTLFAQF